MKKTVSMAVMALAVSAMASSAFAASEVPAMKLEPAAQTKVVKAIKVDIDDSLMQMAEEKGLTVEELLALLKQEGKIKVGDIESVKSLVITKDGELPEGVNAPMLYTITKPAMTVKQGDQIEPLHAEWMVDTDQVAAVKAIDLEELAKEQGITVDELIAQLKQKWSDAEVFQMEIKDLAIEPDNR